MTRKATFTSVASSMLLLLAIILAACAPPRAATEAVPITAPEGAKPPTDKVELTVSLPRGGDRLDPQRSTIGTTAYLDNLIYDPLVVKDPETGELHPWLAESFSRSDDGRVWTFRLRDGVKFHDGIPLNADAVVETMERFVDPDTQNPNAQFMGSPRVTKIDDMTVEVAYDTYWSPFEDQLLWTGAKLGILSPAAIEEYGLEYGQHPVGTGPFMFKEWVEGDHITLVKNPDYSLPKEPFYSVGGAAKIDTLTFKILPNAQVRLQAQLAGQTQVMLHTIPMKDVEALRADSTQEVHCFTGPLVQYIGLNVEKEPTSETAVRKALSLAVDRDLIIDELMYGSAAPAYGYIPASLKDLGYRSDELKDVLANDPDAARQMLDDAGWKAGSDGIRARNGSKLELELWSQNTVPDKDIAEALQSMWTNELGMDVKLETMEPSTFWNTLKEGRMNAWLGPSMMWEPDFLAYHFDSSRIPGTNRYRYSNPVVDGLLQEGRTTFDQSKRDGIYAEIQEIVHVDDAVGIPVFYPAICDVYSSNVTNYMVHPSHDEYPLWVDLMIK